MRHQLKKIEIKIREFRDQYLIRPLATSRQFQRQVHESVAALVLDLDDHKLAIDPNDHVIAGTVMKSGSWHREEMWRIMASIPKGGNVFVDVGDNIGTQTIYALLSGKFDRAVCFEPVPRNLFLLKLNLFLNGLEDRVTVIPTAAGAVSGKSTINLSKHNGGGHSLIHNNLGGQKIEIDVSSVEATLKQLGINKRDIGLAWIDVEGFEHEVIKGWPSLTGTPLMMEYCPSKEVFPASFLESYTQWAIVDEKFSWQSIHDFDPLKFNKQLDLLFI